MTKEDSGGTQNERLMVSVRVRPTDPFRESQRAVAVLDAQTLLFSEPPVVDRGDPEHNFRSGTLFHGGSSGDNSGGAANVTSTPATRTGTIGRSNLNNHHSQSLTHIPHYQTPLARQTNNNNNNNGSSSGGTAGVEVGKAYDFDSVFDETSTQEEVYKSTAAPLVRSVMEGFCATVFAYGATGSGKTYTMIGTPANPGIMARAVDDIFRLCANQKKDVKSEVYLSYLEVYNEQIRDLLRPTPGVQLDLREDKDQVHVAGLSEIRATSTHEVLNLLQKGNKARTMEATAANITSSRSHAVLQVSVRQVSSRTGLITEGKLYLIDLAGSERASNTKNSGVRLREGGHINRSLLALGNCITALASGDGDKYINYRDSKLTRLLKAALGGPSKTAMIAHISPGVQQREETRNTLLYARRARAISNRVKKFTYQGQATDTNHIIQELRNEVKRLQLKLDQRDSHSSDASGASYTIATNNGSSSNLLQHIAAPSPPLPGGGGGGTSEKNTVDSMLGKRDRPDLSGIKDEIVQLFDEEFRLRNDLIKLDGAMLQSALDCEILRLMVLDWETLKIQRDSDGEATSEESDNGKSEINSVMDELKQVRKEQDKLLLMRSSVESQLKATRAKISQTEDDASQYLPEIQREILSVLCKLQQEQVQKISVEIEAELKRRGSLLLRCLRQKALGEAIIHRQRHFLNAIAGTTPKTSAIGSSGRSGGSRNSSTFLPPLGKSIQHDRLFHSPPSSNNQRSSRNHFPPLLTSSGIPKTTGTTASTTTKYSEFRKSRFGDRRRSSSEEDLMDAVPTSRMESTKFSVGRKNESPEVMRYKTPY